MKLSIVATLYRSAPHVIEFHARSSAAARRLVGEDNYEIVLVNDGSPDNSLDMAIELAQADPHLVVVDLSRNFGHHKAILAGLAQAQGTRVFLIDSDLEEDPEYLHDFTTQMNREACDVVYGVQEKRKGGWFERFSGALFWMLIRFFSGLRLPANVVTARLMSRRYVDALLLHRESEVFLAGLWFITGFEQQPHVIKKHDSSDTTYTLGKKLALFINSVTSFSNTPLIAIFYIGLFITLLSGSYVAYILGRWALFSISIVGWASLIASIWLFGGLVILFLGIIGIYLSKIFLETKQRPSAIIKAIHGIRPKA